MYKKNVLTFIVLGVMFLLIFLFVYIEGRESRELKNSEFPYLTMVSDEDMFYSVSNNLNKLFLYANEDYDNINYIVKGNINYNDYQNVSFSVNEEMVISHLNLYKYYIKGKFYTDYFDALSTYLRDGYFVLNYDKNTNSFLIEVIDEEEYNNASNDKQIYSVIDSNSYNSFENISVSDKSRVFTYFYDFKNKLLNDIELSYGLVDNDTKVKYFDSLDKYKKYFEELDNIDVVYYSVNDNVIGIKDNNDIEYIFNISGILKYSVTINIVS